MRPNIGTKILIVFVILLAGWFFIRTVRLLIPVLIIAIVVGYIWDWTDKRSDKYDNYR